MHEEYRPDEEDQADLASEYEQEERNDQCSLSSEEGSGIIAFLDDLLVARRYYVEFYVTDFGDGEVCEDVFYCEDRTTGKRLRCAGHPDHDLWVHEINFQILHREPGGSV